MKSTKFYIFITVIFFLFMLNVNAASKNICNVGYTDGLLYDNEWHFTVTYNCGSRNVLYDSGKLKCADKAPMGTADIPVFGGPYLFDIGHGKVKICPETGCSGDEFDTTFMFNGYNPYSLVTHKNYFNIYATDTKGLSSVYTDAELIDLLERGNCPNYIYVASSKSKQKLAFIFSYEKIKGVAKIFKDAGYVVSFTEQDGGEDLNVVNDENYKNQIQKMKDNIQLYKDNDWSNVYSVDCSKFDKFGGLFNLGTGDYTENTTLMYYEKYREEIFKTNPNYDFTEGDNILEEYKTYNCAPKPDPGDLPTLQTGKITCDDIFKTNGAYNSTWKLLNTTIRFIQYLGILLSIVLSIIDFVKAIIASDKSEIKKASIRSAKRLGIAILIFFIPIILNFLLGLIGFNNPTCGLF